MFSFLRFKLLFEFRELLDDAHRQSVGHRQNLSVHGITGGYVTSPITMAAGHGFGCQIEMFVHHAAHLSLGPVLRNIRLINLLGFETNARDLLSEQGRRQLNLSQGCLRGTVLGYVLKLKL